MILSEKASKKIVSIMVTNNKIDNNLSEAYEYCIDFALDLIFFNLSLLIAGLITHNFILSVIYVFMLVPVKMLAGGAHASSPISCFILSWSIYTTCILLCHVIPDVRILNLIIYSLAGIGICMLAPVEHKNKHYSGADRIRSKHCCTLLLVIIFILLIIMVSFHLYRYCNMIMLCSIIIFANQIIGHLQLHFHKEGPL